MKLRQSNARDKYKNDHFTCRPLSISLLTCFKRLLFELIYYVGTTDRKDMSLINYSMHAGKKHKNLMSENENTEKAITNTNL